MSLARPRRGGLWQNPDFLKLWGALATSELGTQIASLAYTLTAVITLQASVFQVGLLNAVGPAASGLVGLLAGVVVDRVSRRRLLVLSDFGRALLAITIPAAYFIGTLRIEHLYVVAFLAGFLNILADVGMMSYMPALVKREDLVEGNSKFAATDSFAFIAGTGASGALVQALTAPVAIIVDALSFVISGVLLLLIGKPEVARAEEKRGQGLWKEIGEGLGFVYGNAILRSLAQSLGLHFFFTCMNWAIFTLYAVRELGFEPVLLGVVIAMVGVGFLISSFTTGVLTRRFGLGPTVLCGSLVTGLAFFLMPLRGATTAATAAILIGAHLLLAWGIQTNTINMMSLRQAITPDRLQGRMNASFRFVNVCMMMLGSLTAGVLGETIGLRATLIVAAFGMFLPFKAAIFADTKPARAATSN